ncbi:hypothetical protein CEXT_239091 [Caerostris extrusa]|uniref:Secreted protein n=1 Tax=Caerostris extrusa TaxID=172846 RepID=A0AAV4W7L7_CAEEX|nr:hypothetical protein CEXT_239091 [Caerostris extrusa]
MKLLNNLLTLFVVFQYRFKLPVSRYGIENLIDIDDKICLYIFPITLGMLKTKRRNQTVQSLRVNVSIRLSTNRKLSDDSSRNTFPALSSTQKKCKSPRG